MDIGNEPGGTFPDGVLGLFGEQANLTCSQAIFLILVFRPNELITCKANHVINYSFAEEIIRAGTKRKNLVE